METNFNNMTTQSQQKNLNLFIRKSIETDLEVFFVIQLDEEANFMAAFTAPDPTDKEAFFEKWKKNMNDPTNNMHTIILDNEIVGSISKYELFGEAEITYWIEKSYWGNGIATKALTEFLKTEKARPINGRVAFDNIGSKKVLEKCGFKQIGTDKYFANARRQEIVEIIFKLTK